MENKHGCPCRMCVNAATDEELTPDDDLSYIGIGECEDRLRMMFRTGDGKPTEILVERWHEQHGWQTVGFYRPAYCPNCGRLLIENLKGGKENGCKHGGSVAQYCG